MNQIFILHIKEPNAFFAFGSLKQIFERHSEEIKRSIDTLYRINFDLDDYEDENVVIMRRTVQRAKHSKSFL